MNTRLLYKMLMLAAVLTTLQANAAIYIVGSEPFGNWDPSAGVEMNDNGDGTYSYSAQIYGDISFVFADGLSNDWATFNINYRLGPTIGEDQDALHGLWWDVQKGNYNDAFLFTGNGSTYNFTFDRNNMQIMISGGDFYNFESGGFYYNITSNNTVSLTHSETYASNYSGDVIVPSSVTYNGVTYTVTEIGLRAFYDCEELTSVIIPSTVTRIRKSAFFYCTALTSVMIPESVTTIEDWNFYKSDELTTVTLPSTLNQMGKECFASCSKLAKVTCRATTPPILGLNCFATNYTTSPTLYVPENSISVYQANSDWSFYFGSITAMPEYDFMYNNLRFVITSGNTAKVIGPAISSPSGSWSIPGQAAFQGKSYKITEVGSYAFFDCENITSISIGANVTTIGPYAFYLCTKLESLALPSRLNIISDAAFGDCHSLSTVNLPSNLTFIGDIAFCNCPITSVYIPASVQYMGVHPFTDCLSLTEINVATSNENYTSEDGVLFNKSKTQLIGYPAGKSATSYIVPESVNDIAQSAFNLNQYLERVELPANLQYVNFLAFANCQALTQVICLAQTPPIAEDHAFEATIDNTGITLTVPKGRRNAYMAADIWKDFPSIQEMKYDFKESGIYYRIIGAGTVEVTSENDQGNSYSGAVNIPEVVTHNGVDYTVTSIGANAFEMSKSLTSVTIPNTVTLIGNYAFHYCEGLTNVVIPNSVTNIGTCAFWLCLNLREAIIPNSVMHIGQMAFRNCTAMTRVVIGENVEDIGATCFYYNPNINEVICLAETPPVLYNANSSMSNFMAAVYQNATLRVPYDSHNAYRNDGGWSLFANIVSENVENPSLIGDVNNDGNISIKDVTELINYLLTGNSSGINLAVADVNSNNEISISDVTSLIGKLLSGTGGSAVGTAKRDYLINAVPFTMIKVNGGTFMMGIENSQSASPVHQVTLPDYNIGETEVTQALWQVVMGSNPSRNKSDENLPVENMTWDDCQTFAAKLSQLTGRNFRLPTEAEWEFAARGGNQSQGYTYAGSNNLDQVAWYKGNSNDMTHIVATKSANELGLYDMSGNVFEWCQDYWDSYTSDAQTNPQGPASGEYRVCRSSAYNRENNNDWFKCGGRTFDSPTSAAFDTGLRIASDD